MKGMWVGYGVGCTMRLTLGHGAWQIDQPSNGSMWNSYSFQPVGQWMGYSFTDLGAEGCCRSLNALFYEKYDWSNHSMIECKFKKVNNWTTTTYAPMGAFDYTTNGVTMHAHSCITLASLSWYELTHNTPKHFQTCHKIVPYKTVDI